LNSEKKEDIIISEENNKGSMHLLLLGHFLNKNFFSYFGIDNQTWRKEKKAPIYSTPSYAFSRLSSLTESGSCLKRIRNRERARDIETSQLCLFSFIRSTYA
jgi:hypothetical protein